MPTLDWLNREQAMQLADAVPYRLLESVGSHGDPNAGNLLIQGDNLEALKALLPFYRGRAKCIFIDPPYNTRSAFEHYEDIPMRWRSPDKRSYKSISPQTPSRNLVLS